MKRIVLILFIFAVAGYAATQPFAPRADGEEILLARLLYTLARDEGDEAMFALGGVVMNRVRNPWFPDTIGEVIREPHQFAYGSKYDERSLRVARAAIAGDYRMDRGALYYQAMDATHRWDPSAALAVIGNYGFYAERGV